MVTKIEAIEHINQKLDKKTNEFISGRLYERGHSIDGLSIKDIITIIIQSFFNDDASFIQNIQKLDQERTYLLTQVEIFENQETILQHLMNLSEANNDEQILNTIITQYFAEESNPQLIRSILTTELGINQREAIVASSDVEIDNLVDSIHRIIGTARDIYSPLGIAYRAIHRVNLAEEETTITYNEFVAMMSFNQTLTGTDPSLGHNNLCCIGSINSASDGYLQQ